MVVMVRHSVTGSVGDAEVKLTIRADEEELANLVYADIYGRLDVLNQIAEHGIEPKHTERPMSADWTAYLNDELPREDDNE